MCFRAIGCQYSTLNRLFGCVFLVWRHHLREVSKSLVHSFRRFFLQFSYCLMFLNIQIDLIILKTFDQQFTLTTKKSLHIIFKATLHTQANRAVDCHCPATVKPLLDDQVRGNSPVCITAEWPQQMAHLHRSANGRLLSDRGWSSHLLLGQCGGRFQLRSESSHWELLVWWQRAWCAGLLSSLAVWPEHWDNGDKSTSFQ